MIPNFDENGHLPPGIYEVTFDEIIERFSSSIALSRKKRTASLEAFYDEFKPFIKHLYIDGSYITDKPDPSDVDIIVFFKDDYVHTQEHIYRFLKFLNRKESYLDILHCKSNHEDRVRRCWSRVAYYQQNDRDFDDLTVDKGILLVREIDYD